MKAFTKLLGCLLLLTLSLTASYAPAQADPPNKEQLDYPVSASANAVDLDVTVQNQALFSYDAVYDYVFNEVSCYLIEIPGAHYESLILVTVPNQTLSYTKELINRYRMRPNNPFHLKEFNMLC